MTPLTKQEVIHVLQSLLRDCDPEMGESIQALLTKIGGAE